MEPAYLVRDVHIPVLFIGCWNDDRAPYSAVKCIYDNAASVDKELWMTNGRRHFDSFFYNPDAYARKIDQFIEAHIQKDRSNEGVIV